MAPPATGPAEGRMEISYSRRYSKYRDSSETWMPSQRIPTEMIPAISFAGESTSNMSWVLAIIVAGLDPKNTAGFLQSNPSPVTDTGDPPRTDPDVGLSSDTWSESTNSNCSSSDSRPASLTNLRELTTMLPIEIG